MPTDRQLREMRVYSAGERVSVVVASGSQAASTVGTYHNAIRRYVETGDDAALRSFRGTTVAGVELETDPDVIDELGRRGVLSIESIYRLGT